MDFITFLNFMKENGIAFALLVLFVFLICKLINIIIDEDKASAFRAKIYKSLFTLTGRREQENRYIRNDINSKLNLARKKINYTSEILPRSVDIEWVDGEGKESYKIKEGEFVVCLDSSASQEKNIVRLANEIVKNTSLIGLHRILSTDLDELFKLNITKNLLKAINDKKVMDYFFTDEYVPSVKSSVERESINNKIIEVDERGMFTRILLSELYDFSQRIYGMEPRPYMLGEVESLLTFLYNIANKQYHQDVPLLLELAHIRTSLILVADTSKILAQGIEPYLKCAIYRSEKQLYSIYLVVWDKEHLGSYDKDAAEAFIKAVDELDQQIVKKTKVKKEFQEKYCIIDNFGNKRNAKMTKYIINKIEE